MPKKRDKKEVGKQNQLGKKWSDKENEDIEKAIKIYGTADYVKIQKVVGTRTLDSIKQKVIRL